MTKTRTNDITEVSTLDGPTIREALGDPSSFTESSQALATTDSTTTLAVPDDWTALAGAFDDGSAAFVEHFGLTMPRLRSDFGRNGQGWVDDLTGEATRELRIVILAQPPSRTFWLKSIDEGGGGGRPDCKSTNLLANRPDEGVPEPQSAKCSACPHSQWGEAEDGTPVKPACSEAVNVLAFDLDNERYVWLAFRGMSISPYRKYVSAIYSRKLVPFAVETKVSLKDAERGSLKFLVAQFAIGDPVPLELAAELRGVAQKAMATWESEADAMAAADEAPRFSAGDEPFGDAPAGHEDEEF